MRDSCSYDSLIRFFWSRGAVFADHTARELRHRVRGCATNGARPEKQKEDADDGAQVSACDPDLMRSQERNKGPQNRAKMSDHQNQEKANSVQ